MIDPRTRWPDERVDDLASAVRAVAPLVTDVAVIKADLRTLSKELHANTNATKAVAEQFEKVQLEPLRRSQTFRSGLAIAIVGALCGGGLALIGAIIASSH